MPTRSRGSCSGRTCWGCLTPYQYRSANVTSKRWGVAIARSRSSAIGFTVHPNSERRDPPEYTMPGTRRRWSGRWRDNTIGVSRSTNCPWRTRGRARASEGITSVLNFYPSIWEPHPITSRCATCGRGCGRGRVAITSRIGCGRRGRGRASHYWLFFKTSTVGICAIPIRRSAESRIGTITRIGSCRGGCGRGCSCCRGGAARGPCCRG